jgi:hypothetical protein
VLSSALFVPSLNKSYCPLFVLSDNVSINNILHHIIIETTTLIFNKVRKQRKELDYHTKLCAVTTPQHEHSEHKKRDPQGNVHLQEKYFG